ncbi:MAG: hypothetical protein HYU97_03110 [Deltaproteobacteria bacterium]|nr:hypothetical protein [Deltaproteobacteria bacterium]
MAEINSIPFNDLARLGFHLYDPRNTETMFVGETGVTPSNWEKVYIFTPTGITVKGDFDTFYRVVQKALSGEDFIYKLGNNNGKLRQTSWMEFSRGEIVEEGRLVEEGAHAWEKFVTHFENHQPILEEEGRMVFSSEVSASFFMEVGLGDPNEKVIASSLFGGSAMMVSGRKEYRPHKFYKTKNWKTLSETECFFGEDKVQKCKTPAENQRKLRPTSHGWIITIRGHPFEVITDPHESHANFGLLQEIATALERLPESILIQLSNHLSFHTMNYPRTRDDLRLFRERFSGTHWELPDGRMITLTTQTPNSESRYIKENFPLLIEGTDGQYIDSEWRIYLSGSSGSTVMHEIGHCVMIDLFGEPFMEEMKYLWQQYLSQAAKACNFTDEERELILAPDYHYSTESVGEDGLQKRLVDSGWFPNSYSVKNEHEFWAVLFEIALADSQKLRNLQATRHYDPIVDAIRLAMTDNTPSSQRLDLLRYRLVGF